MKKSLILLFSLIFTGIVYSQENTQMVEKGDIVILGNSSGSLYQHVDFPRKNFIMKRGSIANFHELVGENLIVESVNNTKDGKTDVTLRRNNGLNFFRFYPTVNANLEMALANGELKIPQDDKIDSIAK
ncbi:MAG: hypothetical protein HKN31_05530 [Pricia sp.]|nr:hypothetical protein [Pricia sp.]